EEDAIVRADTHLLGKAVHPLLAVILGNGAAPLAPLARSVAEPGEALASSPLVHVVEEFARQTGGVRGNHRADNSATPCDLRKKAKARAFEVGANIADQQRVAQIGLVGAVV